MVRVKHFFVAAAAALLLFGAQAKADPQSVQWEYIWTNNVGNSIPSDPDDSAGGASTGNVNFLQSPTFKTITGSSNVVAANLFTVSTAPNSAPSTLNAAGNYVLTMSIKLKGSDQVMTLDFAGKLGGFFSAESAQLLNEFSDPMVQTVTLGGFNFTVTIGPFTPPEPLQLGGGEDDGKTIFVYGSIGARVDVSTANPGGGGDTPEPSALVLSGLGLSALGFAAWRRRRAARA